MAKSANGIMGGGAMMSPRKAMAAGMGDGSGNFGTTSFKDVQGPKSIMGPKSTGGEMGDGQRGIGQPIGRGKGMHPAQAAPNHGDHKIDSKRYGGKV